MPLKKGSSKKTISKNIGELTKEYTSGDGMIGNIKPKSLKHAQSIATAIAYKKAGKSNKGGKKSGKKK